jgi:hypothetical protein
LQGPITIAESLSRGSIGSLEEFGRKVGWDDLDIAVSTRAEREEAARSASLTHMA